MKDIQGEKIQNVDRYVKRADIEADDIEKAIENVIHKIDANMATFKKNTFPKLEAVLAIL